MWFSQLKGMNFAALRYFNAAGYDTKKRVLGLENNPQNLIPLVMETAIGKRKNPYFWERLFDKRWDRYSRLYSCF